MCVQGRGGGRGGGADLDKENTPNGEELSLRRSKGHPSSVCIFPFGACVACDWSVVCEGVVCMCVVSEGSGLTAHV